MNTKLKELYRKAFQLLPSYFIWKAKVEKQIDSDELERVVRRIIKDVPYYSHYKELISNGFDLNCLPIIRKKDVLGQEKNMVSNRAKRRKLMVAETGGSTGCSLTLYRHWKDKLIHTAFANHTFSLIGDHLVVGVLRGNKPKEGLFEVISKNRIILSSYGLGNDTLDQYLEILSKYKISCLHAYPSSLAILARLIKRKYGQANLPCLKGILTSSEIFSKEDKQLVREVFPAAKIVDFYGHSEMACCAYSVNEGYYHFYPWYGHVEFIDTDETINGNRIAEIVATSVMDTTMPFIRYATDDYAELDNEGNVVSIIGRTSDFLVNCNKELVPCIISTRTESLQNVTNFQYYQDEIGKMTFRIVVNERFGNDERRSLLEDLQSSFSGAMECHIEEVPTIERTKAGKQKRLVQNLNISDYL